jgi:hypothetical protein
MIHDFISLFLINDLRRISGFSTLRQSGSIKAVNSTLPGLNSSIMDSFQFHSKRESYPY